MILIKSSHLKTSKVPKIQTSEILKWSKWQFLVLPNDQNWFHVKSEWPKNPEICILCIPRSVTYSKSTGELDPSKSWVLVYLLVGFLLSFLYTISVVSLLFVKKNLLFSAFHSYLIQSQSFLSTQETQKTFFPLLQRQACLLFSLHKNEAKTIVCQEKDFLVSS